MDNSKNHIYNIENMKKKQLLHCITATYEDAFVWWWSSLKVLYHQEDVKICFFQDPYLNEITCMDPFR